MTTSTSTKDDTMTTSAHRNYPERHLLDPIHPITLDAIRWIVDEFSRCLHLSAVKSPADYLHPEHLDAAKLGGGTPYRGRLLIALWHGDYISPTHVAIIVPGTMVDSGVVVAQSVRYCVQAATDVELDEDGGVISAVHSRDQAVLTGEVTIVYQRHGGQMHRITPIFEDGPLKRIQIA